MRQNIHPATSAAITATGTATPMAIFAPVLRPCLEDVFVAVEDAGLLAVELDKVEGEGADVEDAAELVVEGIGDVMLK